MLDRFSYSSIQTFKKCPAQFKFKYIDKIYKKDESIEAFLGKRVHESIEYLYNRIKSGFIPILDEILKVHRSLWKEKWHKKIAIYYTKKSPRDYFFLGEQCISRYYRKYHPFSKNVLSNEYEVEFNLDNDPNYRLKGIIDRIDHDGKGNWSIHDYKTGKRYFTQEEAEKDTQLALYQIGITNKFDEVKSVQLVWHFLQHGIMVKLTKTDDELSKVARKTKMEIDKIRSEINNSREFKPNPMILCNWCYYWDECTEKDTTNPYTNN